MDPELARLIEEEIAKAVDWNTETNVPLMVKVACNSKCKLSLLVKLAGVAARSVLSHVPAQYQSCCEACIVAVENNSAQAAVAAAKSKEVAEAWQARIPACDAAIAAAHSFADPQVYVQLAVLAANSVVKLRPGDIRAVISALDLGGGYAELRVRPL
jgi:hypothetical protein